MYQVPGSCNCIARNCKGCEAEPKRAVNGPLPYSSPDRSTWWPYNKLESLKDPNPGIHYRNKAAAAAATGYMLFCDAGPDVPSVLTQLGPNDNIWSNK